LAFGKLDSMSSKLVAKAIVLSSLCATGIVAQTTLANAGPLAGLPCKKALGAVVRGDDACVKIGGAYVWRRLANVNDPGPSGAQPSTSPATAVAAVPVPVVPATTKAPSAKALAVLPDPCAVLDPGLLAIFAQNLKLKIDSHSLTASANLRECSMLEAQMWSFSSSFYPTYLAFTKIESKIKSKNDGWAESDYLPTPEGYNVLIDKYGSIGMSFEFRGVRAFMFVGNANGVPFILAQNDAQAIFRDVVAKLRSV
jgi:hypothetical protein